MRNHSGGKVKTSTGKPTKRDQRRFQALQAMGCICCRRLRIKVTPEIHHLLSGNKRMGHQFTIPLCIWHHRGVQKEGWSNADMTATYGPSLAHGSKPFKAHWGSAQELLDEVNGRV